tara:strand:- start:434 stop:1363 length:930 start_codon:yes stop_codon:yes gene_type:complete
MKYIITSGCSFTNNIRLNPNNLNEIHTDRLSWPYYLQKELGKEYKVLNYGGATNDNVSLCRIFFYHIQRLISEGINPKDIIVIGQWSDPNRESIWIKSKFTEEDRAKYGHTLVYTPNWENENGFFYLTGGFSPPDDEYSALKKFGLDNAIKYWEADINWNNILNQVLHWLESWSHLERFCKDNEIDTYWMSMRNPFSQEAYEGWFGAPNNDSDIPTKKLWLENYEILKPYINEVPINKSNYWHYKNYNGLLEWTIDNIEEGVPYFQESEGKYLSWEDYKSKIHEYGWGHPSPQMMRKFVKEELIKIIKL